MPDQIIIQVFIALASASYQMAQEQKMKKKMDAAAEARKGQKFTVSGSSAPLPVVYGKQRIGGIHCNYKVNSSYPSASENADEVLATAFGSLPQSGSKNEFLGVQTALCHGGIESVKHILVNDVDYRGYTKEMKENKSSFNHRFLIHKNGGTADNSATAFGFPSTNKFTGCAYVTNFFKLNRDEPQYSGIPSMGYIVKGRKVRTVTRSGSSPNYTYSLSSSYTYSNNPALCLLDYLLNSDFGRGLTATSVDLESFYNAADICDTPVLTGATIGGEVNDVKPIFSYTSQSDFPTTNIEPYMAGYLYYDETNDKLYTQTQSGSAPNITASYTLTTAPATDTIPLYECNITLSTEETIRNNIERILNTMGLSDLVWTPQGKYKLILSYPQTQSQQNALVTHTFNEENIIRESVKLMFPKAQDRFNQITVSFDNEFENFKDDTLTWPPTNSSVHQTYLTEDNNQPLTTSLQGDGVTSKYHAQALAEQQVRKSRSLYTLNFSVNKEGLTVEPGDLVKVNIPTMSINNELYRVEAIKVLNNFSVEISAYKFDFSVLAWNVPNDLDYVIKPSFDFKVEAPTSGSFTLDLSNNIGTASGKLNWTAANDASINEYIIEVSPDNGSNYYELGRTFNTSFDITGLKTGVYDFSIRSKNITGLLSERLLVENKTIQLKTVGQIKAIYADDSSGTNKTTTWSGQEYVIYHEYDSDFNINNVTGTWAKFIGDSGNRGAGWWRYSDTTNASTFYYASSTVNQTNVNNAFSSAVGLTKQEGDRLIISATDTAVAFIYSSSAWVYQSAFLDGNLLVNGTVTADELAVGSVTSSKIAASQSIAAPFIDGGFIRGAVIEAGVLLSQQTAWPCNQDLTSLTFAPSGKGIADAFTLSTGSGPHRISSSKVHSVNNKSITNAVIPANDRILNINRGNIPNIADYTTDTLNRNWGEWGNYKVKIALPDVGNQNDGADNGISKRFPQMTIRIKNGSGTTIATLNSPSTSAGNKTSSIPADQSVSNTYFEGSWKTSGQFTFNKYCFSRIFGVCVGSSSNNGRSGIELEFNGHIKLLDDHYIEVDSFWTGDAFSDQTGTLTIDSYSVAVDTETDNRFYPVNSTQSTVSQTATQPSSVSTVGDSYTPVYTDGTDIYTEAGDSGNLDIVNDTGIIEGTSISGVINDVDMISGTADFANISSPSSNYITRIEQVQSALSGKGIILENDDTEGPTLALGSFDATSGNITKGSMFYTPGTGLVIDGVITAGAVRGGNLVDSSNKATTDNTSGGYIDLDAGNFLFGEAKSDGEFVKWDGSALNISGSAITAGSFTGNLTGNVSGNVSGTAGAAGDVALNAIDNGNTVSLTAGDTSSNITFAAGGGISVNAVATANNDTITVTSNITQNNSTNQSVTGAGNVTVNQSGNTFTVTANDVDTDTTYTGSGNVTVSANNVITANDTDTTYTGSGNVTVSANNVITANDSDTTYSAGTGISISNNNVISTNITQTANQTVSGSGNVTVNQSGNTFTVTANDSTGNLNNVTSNNNLITFNNTNDEVAFNGNTPGSGNLRNVDSVNYTNQVNSKPTLGNLASSNVTLGSLADQNTVSYTNEVTSKPTLGNLASSNTTLGSLADQNTVSYTNEVTGKPTLGNLASSNTTLGSLATSNTTLGSLATSNTTLGNLATSNTTLGSLADQNTVSYTNEVTDKPTLVTRANTLVTDNSAEANSTGISVSGNTFSHHDTSSVASPQGYNSNTSNSMVVGMSVDGFGHVTGVTTGNLAEPNDTFGTNTNSKIAIADTNGEFNIVAGSITADTMTTTSLNATEATIGTAQIDSLIAASAQITNLNAAQITASNIDTNVLNAQQTVAGRSLQVGNLIPSANAAPASGAGMYVVGSDNAGASGTTAGDFVVGDTNAFMSWDTSAANLTVQGDIIRVSPAVFRTEVAGWIRVEDSFNDLSNIMTGGAGLYAFLMCGGGGGGSLGSNGKFNVNVDTGAVGGSAGGGAIFAFSWDGNTTLGLTVGTGGYGQIARTVNNSASAAGNATTLNYGGSALVTTNGANAATFGPAVASSVGSGGNAVFTNNLGVNFLHQTAVSGGTGGAWKNNTNRGAGGGGGIPFFGFGNISAASLPFPNTSPANGGRDNGNSGFLGHGGAAGGGIFGDGFTGNTTGHAFIPALRGVSSGVSNSDGNLGTNSLGALFGSQADGGVAWGISTSVNSYTVGANEINPNGFLAGPGFLNPRGNNHSSGASLRPDGGLFAGGGGVVYNNNYTGNEISGGHGGIGGGGGGHYMSNDATNDIADAGYGGDGGFFFLKL